MTNNPLEFKENYDVIIVGAGPGGSIAARDCAERGLETLVIEKRQELGTPVRCGEGLGEAWMDIAGLEYDPTWCVKEIKGAIVFPPNGKSLKMPTENKGYIVERKIFEKRLAEQAGRKGAKYLLKTRVKHAIKEDGKVKGVVAVDDEGQEKEYRAKIVIAADGVESPTAKSIGINTVNKLIDIESGYEYEMTNINVNPEDTEYINIWIGNEIAPGGYIWAFYKSNDTANVGIGVNSVMKEKTAKEYLDEWITNNPQYFENAVITEKKGGAVPIGKPIEQPYENGFMIIGDAAHMVNPIHGGGMGIAMESARIAAKVAAEAIKQEDYSKEFLSKFAEEWWETRGKQLLEVQKVRKFVETLSDKEFNKLREILDAEGVLELTEASDFSKFLKIFKKSPKIAMKAVKAFK